MILIAQQSRPNEKQEIKVKLKKILLHGPKPRHAPRVKRFHYLCLN